MASQNTCDKVCHKFRKEETVFALAQDGIWYKAKIIQLSVDLHPESGEQTPTYRVHYIGFGKRQREWILEECLLAFNEGNKEIVELQNAEKLPSGSDATSLQKATIEDEECEEEVNENEVDLDDDEQPGLGIMDCIHEIAGTFREQLLTPESHQLRTTAYTLLQIDVNQADPAPLLEHLLWNSINQANPSLQGL